MTWRRSLKQGPEVVVLEVVLEVVLRPFATRPGAPTVTELQARLQLTASVITLFLLFPRIDI